MTDVSPISKEILDRDVRRLCRHIAAVIISAMGETDTDFAAIAARTGRTEKSLRRWLARMIDGEAADTGLVLLANFTTATNCQVRFSLHQLPPQKPNSSITLDETTGDAPP